jgi:hypothetical protein
MTTSSTTANRTGIAKLWLLNFVANAAVLAVAYFWLLIPDARGWQVAGSALLAAFVLVMVLWLRAGTLAYFRVAEFRKDGSVGRAYRHSLRHVPALALWVLVFVVFAWMVFSVVPYVPQFAVWLRQKLGAGPSPRHLMAGVNALLFLVIFGLMPGLWLPIATTVSAIGFAPEHIVRSRRVWKRPMYWLWFCLLFGIGIYVPYKMVWWIPDLQTIRQQCWSMSLRFLLAYVIGVTAFLAVVWMAAWHTDHEDPIEDHVA